MHYKNDYKFSIALLLMFTMLLSIIPAGVFAGADKGVKTPQQIAQEAADGAVGYYAQQDKLTEWEQLGGIKGAGESLQSVKWKNKLPTWEKKELKGTEYASHILGMLAQGEDPRTIFSDKNIVEELEKKQDLNGSFGNLNSHAWAIIALDAAGGTYDTDAALTYLVSKQKNDGGFDFWDENALVGGPDDTGMALIALSNHKEKDTVQSAINSSIKFLQKIQLEDSAGFSSWGTENPNTIATIISGLVAIGEDVLTDKWQKDNKTMLDALLAFQLENQSFFSPYSEEDENGQPLTDDMATRQALIALGDISHEDSVWKRLDVGSVHLRIEDSLNNILDKNITVLADEKDYKVYKLIEKALDKDNIEYEITAGDAVTEIINIQGKSKGQFGGEDRWFCLINGKSLNTGIEEKINDGDEILIYYGMPAPNTVIPSIDTSPSKPKVGDDFKVTVRSQEDQTVNITGATVTFNNKKYITDDDGIATIKGEDVNKAGRYTFKVSKDVQGSYPLIVRTGNLFVDYLSKDNNDGSSGDVTEVTSKQASLYVKGDKNVFLQIKNIDLKKGDTPFSLLEREFPGQVDYDGSGTSVYVKGIKSLSEFDKGPQSGWMFTVNGDFIQTSPSNYKLEDGDRVEWLYTLDGGKNIGDKDISGTGTTPTDKIEIPDISKEEIIKPSAQMQKVVRDKVKATTVKILAGDNISNWSLFAVARGNDKVSAKQIESVKNTLRENKGDFRKTTDLERTILLVRTLGLDPLNVEGINLVEKVYNHENLERQGVNGLIFALIALDSGNYEIPDGARWTRDKLSKEILSYQNADGSFSLVENGDSDVDITAMAVQSLANYKNEENAKEAITKAVNYLATHTKSENCENIAQTIIALTSLGITPEDSRFMKDDKTLVTRLLSYAKEDGGFSHLKGEAADEIATEQALTALVAYERYLNGQTSIYTLTDKKIESKPEDKTDSAKSYSDIGEISDWALRSVLKAKEYKLMNGTDLEKNTFEGKRSITRAEFVSLLLKLLEEKHGGSADNTASTSTSTEQVYWDVKPGDWHFKAIMTAREKGLVVGTSPDEFAPQKEITRQEMAAILVRSLNLDTSQNTDEANSLKDEGQISDWAKDSVHTAYKAKILVGDNGYFSPRNPVTREMAAAISVRLYEMK